MLIRKLFVVDFHHGESFSQIGTPARWNIVFGRKGSLVDQRGLAGGGFVVLLEMMLLNDAAQSQREFGLISELYQGFPTDEREKEAGRLC